jgi:hypothetical protein
MLSTTFEIVVAIRPPYQHISPSRSEPPEALSLLGGGAGSPARYFIETSSGEVVPLDLEQFTRASRAYQSGHRRFRLGWSQVGNVRRLMSLEPANTSWGPSMPNAAQAIAGDESVRSELIDSRDQ